MSLGMEKRGGVPFLFCSRRGIRISLLFVLLFIMSFFSFPCLYSCLLFGFEATYQLPPPDPVVTSSLFNVLLLIYIIMYR